MSEDGKTIPGEEPKAFLRGVFAVIESTNVDTDVIYPKQFLKTIKRSGLSHAFFANWRFDSDGSEIEPFVLNKQLFRNASILVCGDNFGCGSSREHAVWALRDFGILVVISTSFGTIFRNNCVKNGVWPLKVDQDTLNGLFETFDLNCAQELTIGFDDLSIVQPDGTKGFASLDIAEHERLLSGKDEIQQTLDHIEAIQAFTAQYRAQFPWVTR